MLFHLAIAAVLGAEPIDAVVLIQQGSTTCAGAIIDEHGTVATAYHCVAPGGRPRVTTRSGEWTIGRVTHARVSGDLAVIEAPALAGQPWLPIREAPPAVGESIRVIGHPYGVRAPAGMMEGLLRWSTSEGIVSAVGPRAIQVTAPVNPGNSGGPLIDDDGRLLGVVSRKSAGGEGLGIVARGVDNLLDEAPGHLRPFGGTAGATVFLTTFEGGYGSLSLGVRPEIAFRERVVLSGTYAFAPGAKWSALRFGEVRWIESEARVALRQRVFRGPYTGRIEAWAAWSGVVRLTGAIEQKRASVVRAYEPAPFFGGTLSVSNAGFDMGWSPVGGEFTASMILRWPGVVTVF